MRWEVFSLIQSTNLLPSKGPEGVRAWAGSLMNGLRNKATGRRRQEQEGNVVVKSWDLRSPPAGMKSWHHHVLAVTVDKSSDVSEPRFPH